MTPLPSKTIVVLSVSAGAGHVRAAQAICAAGGDAKQTVRTVHIDVMDMVPAWYCKIYVGWYLALVNRAPTVWGWIYRFMNQTGPRSLLQRARLWIDQRCSARLLKALAEMAPDAIVCTHFLPAEILSQQRAAGIGGCPVWVLVTDFDLHRMWVHPHMTGYFAASEEIAFHMRAHGIDASTVHVTGIPLMPSFGDILSCSESARKLSRAALRDFNLDPNTATVLLMGGGGGLGKLVQIAQALLELDPHFQIIVLAGKNIQALEALQQLAYRWPERLRAFGFTDQVARMMACVDLVITKPGGLSTSECLALGVPMIVNTPIPGQEERNADFLLEQGAALKAVDATTLAWRVRHLLANPSVLEQMGERARALGRPFAARHLLDIVTAQA